MTEFDSRVHEFAGALARVASWREQHGLTGNQCEVLLHVYDRGSPTAAELADLVAITSASMSRLLSVLETGGWIHRRPDERDARRSLVFPSKRLTRAIDDLVELGRGVDDRSKQGRSSRTG